MGQHFATKHNNEEVFSHNLDNQINNAAVALDEIAKSIYNGYLYTTTDQESTVRLHTDNDQFVRYKATEPITKCQPGKNVDFLEGKKFEGESGPGHFYRIAVGEVFDEYLRFPAFPPKEEKVRESVESLVDKLCTLNGLKLARGKTFNKYNKETYNKETTLPASVRWVIWYDGDADDVDDVDDFLYNPAGSADTSTSTENALEILKLTENKTNPTIAFIPQSEKPSTTSFKVDGKTFHIMHRRHFS